MTDFIKEKWHLIAAFILFLMALFFIANANAGVEIKRGMNAIDQL